MQRSLISKPGSANLKINVKMGRSSMSIDAPLANGRIRPIQLEKHVQDDGTLRVTCTFEPDDGGMELLESLLDIEGTASMLKDQVTKVKLECLEIRQDNVQSESRLDKLRDEKKRLGKCLDEESKAIAVSELYDASRLFSTTCRCPLINLRLQEADQPPG